MYCFVFHILASWLRGRCVQIMVGWWRTAAARSASLSAVVYTS